MSCALQSPLKDCGLPVVLLTLYHFGTQQCLAQSRSLINGETCVICLELINKPEQFSLASGSAGKSSSGALARVGGQVRDSHPGTALVLFTPHSPTLPSHEKPLWLGDNQVAGVNWRTNPRRPQRDSCFSQPCVSNIGLPGRLRERRQRPW